MLAYEVGSVGGTDKSGIQHDSIPMQPVASGLAPELVAERQEERGLRIVSGLRSLLGVGSEVSMNYMTRIRRGTVDGEDIPVSGQEALVTYVDLDYPDVGRGEKRVTYKLWVDDEVRLDEGLVTDLGAEANEHRVAGHTLDEFVNPVTEGAKALSKKRTQALRIAQVMRSMQAQLNPAVEAEVIELRHEEPEDLEAAS